MKFQVTGMAAFQIHRYISQHNEPGPVRILLEDVKGCGDKSLKFLTGATIEPEDTVVDTGLPGFVVIANLTAHPEFEGATLDYEINGLNRRLIVRSDKLSTCGCGLSYATKK